MQQSRNALVQPDILDVIAAVARMRSADGVVFFLRDALGLNHVTYHMAWTRSTVIPFIRSTYPQQWVAQYVLRGYVHVDPVIRKGFAETQPFFWHELKLNARAQKFMAEARMHGVGEQGYSIPIGDRLSRHALLTLTSDADRDDWSKFIHAAGPGIVRIAHLIHDKAIEELLATFQPLPTLAPREAECLLWTARGKEAKVIASILGLSEYTVRSYLRTARRKLECKTLSQAVAKAIQSGLINP